MKFDLQLYFSVFSRSSLLIFTICTLFLFSFVLHAQTFHLQNRLAHFSR
jgi:hypothetical protein